jgi:NAD(P)H-flavin reductase
MLARKYKSKIVSIEHSIPGIYMLEFVPLVKQFKYSSGQFLHLAIDPLYDGVGQWPESRCFSIQTSPNSDSIKITYSIVGSFTQQMATLLKCGMVVWLKMPYGNLFDDSKPKENCVFIAGGTGITPFLSLFTSEAFKDYHDARIYLGFKNQSHNIYNKELSEVKVMNPTSRTTIYYEDQVGMLNVNEIHAEQGMSTYYISGPPAMITAFRSILLSNGLPQNQVISDDWA